MEPDRGVWIDPEVTMKMSRVMLVSTLVASAAFLAGCATSQTAWNEPQPGRFYVDGEYVQAVERAARSRGVSVHWINAPEYKAGEPRTGN